MSDQPAYYPKYLPFPEPVVRKGWVPVANTVDFPQAQFGPRFLPPGSGSVQEYVYPDGDRTKILYGGADLYQTFSELSTGKKVVAGLALLFVGNLALYAVTKGRSGVKVF